MSNTPTQYSDELKLAIVRLIHEDGYDPVEVAQNLGIGVKLVRGWLNSQRIRHQLGLSHSERRRQEYFERIEKIRQLTLKQAQEKLKQENFDAAAVSVQKVLFEAVQRQARLGRRPTSHTGSQLANVDPHGNNEPGHNE